MDKPWKVIFAFVGVFIAGAVFGGFFTARTAGKRFQERAATIAVAPAGPQQPQPQPAVGANRPNANRLINAAPGPAITPRMMQQFSERLKLTDDQKAKIRPIVARADEDWLRLRKENFRDTTRVMERMHTDIAEFLTTTQLEELERLKANAQERLKNAEKGNKRPPVIRPNAEAAAAVTVPASDPAPKGK